MYIGWIAVLKVQKYLPGKAIVEFQKHLWRRVLEKL